MLTQLPRLHLEFTECSPTFIESNRDPLTPPHWPASQVFPALPVTDSTFRLPTVRFVLVVSAEYILEQLNKAITRPVLH
ncbi:hypothetical protein [Photobacterium sp. TLY01]|uniref:hypothetical protein n=1 Tax=Photobacterium sp. TLY01 TaxID=2907534 RepID=UPI001F474712|nr:hypothetical protein [Photobacterium sp. TLY01]UIP30371.1 hypothetical protein LN341_16765 [Photobacterium sp. TLY01]